MNKQVDEQTNGKRRQEGGVMAYWEISVNSTTSKPKFKATAIKIVVDAYSSA